MGRYLLVALTALGVCASVGWGGGKAPPKASTGVLRIVFTGQASESLADELRYITVDEGRCYERRADAEQATMTWSVTWSGVRIARLERAGNAARQQTAAGSVNGDIVRDGCDFPELAPPGWSGTTHCDDQLALGVDASITVARGKARSAILAFTAPQFAVPVQSNCDMPIRNDQLITHVKVSTTRLDALKKNRSISLAVGTARPGPGDLYASDLNCSRATKPYDNYRVVDSCRDKLTWSGTVTLTRQ